MKVLKPLFTFTVVPSSRRGFTVESPMLEKSVSWLLSQHQSDTSRKHNCPHIWISG
jgi:hypothetical protein